MAKAQSLLYALLGLGRSGTLLHLALLAAAGAALLLYFVWLPRVRFTDADEHLFRAARHGDRAGIERALAQGARLAGVSPVDGKTALFRAAVFGHAGAVQLLLERGADREARGNDGRTALEVVSAARGEERDPAVAAGLDAVVGVLQHAAEGTR